MSRRLRRYLRQIQQEHVRAHRILEVGAASRFRSFLDQWAGQIADRILETGSLQPIDLLGNPIQGWRASFGPWMERGVTVGLIAEDRLLETFKPTDIQEAAKDGAMLPDISAKLPREHREQVAIWLEARTVGVWGLIQPTVRANLSRIIIEGIDAGDDIRTLSKRVREVLPQYNKAQAKRLARTELNGAQNSGHQRMREARQVAVKIWLSTIDNRTRRGRFDHIEPNNQKQPNLDAFTVSGQQLMFPGDTSRGASAGNIIYCRCVSASDPESLLQPKRRTVRPKKKAAKVKQPAITDVVAPTAAPIDVEEWASGLAAAPVRPMTEQGKRLAKFDTEQRDVKTGRSIMKMRKRLRAVEQSLEATRRSVAALDSVVLDELAAAEVAAEKEWQEALKRYDDIWKFRAEGKLQPAIEAKNKALSNYWKIRNELDAEKEKIRKQVAKLIRPKGGTKARARVRFEKGSSLLGGRADARKWYESVLSAKHGNAPGGNRPEIALNLVGGRNRADYSFGLRRIRGRKNGSAKTMVHEIGHSLEDIAASRHGDQVLEMAKGFLHHRGGTEAPIALETLPDGTYGALEVGLKDELDRAFGVESSGFYAGKFYSNATEIISMGVQLMFDDPISFARRDPEFFRFVLGILRGDLITEEFLEE